MPHIYFKTIGLVSFETVLLLIRVGQVVVLFFHVSIFANETLMALIIAIPGTLLDIALVTIAIAIIINEKLGERWSVSAYALLFAGFVATTFLRLSIG